MENEKTQPGNIVSAYSDSISSMFHDVITNYERNLDIIKQTEEELQDLEHEIELSAPKDMYKGYLMYKEVRDTRLRRRKAKDENELLAEMYEFLKSQVAQNFKTKMNQIQGGAVKVRKQQETRTYRPRQRNDLTITDKTCTAYKPFEELMKDFQKTKVHMSGGKLRK